MEFPFGHHTHHRREEEEEREEQYPPPPYDRRPNFPPPPDYRDEHRNHHQPPPPYGRFGEEQPEIYGDSRYERPQPPPPPQSDYGYSQPPGYPSVQHVSHEFGNQGFQPSYPSDEFRHESNPHHHHHNPFSHHDHSNEYGGGGGSGLPNFNNKPTVRVYTKAEADYSLTIRDGHVILARSNENDEFQHWIKDEKFSIRVKDEEGFPSFALVNKATGQAMKHSTGATHPVQLVPYNPDVLDESILWTESRDLGDGYRTIRMVNNIRLNVDAFNGDKNHGGVRDGTTIVLWEWKKGENQRWKIVPYYYCKEPREGKTIDSLNFNKIETFALVILNV
ncbi:Ricin B lectin domain [Macleaya cordata]|uniref:Ricin B lectin domain n=1 Tax=Macleaya cordata TaxID=56857 RepID=A0A200PML8_MACCD|nr:Ricin B lectin domain [Macleaya cordata]